MTTLHNAAMNKYYFQLHFQMHLDSVKFQTLKYNFETYVQYD